MPYVDSDGVKLYYEEAGTGEAIVFVHEFAGDHRSWEPQIRYFSRFYRCVAYNARGYPPSDVPDDPAMYSQDQATADILNVMRGLDIERAHIVGLSMGSFAALHFGLTYPESAISLVVAGGGYGALNENREQFQGEVEALAARIEADGMTKATEAYASGPFRRAFMLKDPRGFEEFQSHLREHSAKGSAMTLRGVQKERPSFPELAPQLKEMFVPTLLIAGDEDDPSVDSTLYLKRIMPAAGLAVFPKSGHAMNLEEPELFNRMVKDFFTSVSNGRWTNRDMAALTGRIM